MVAEPLPTHPTTTVQLILTDTAKSSVTSNNVSLTAKVLAGVGGVIATASLLALISPVEHSLGAGTAPNTNPINPHGRPCGQFPFNSGQWKHCMASAWFDRGTSTQSTTQRTSTETFRPRPPAAPIQSFKEAIAAEGKTIRK